MGLATANDSDSPTAIAAGQSGVGSHTFKEGQEFTISIKGVGWTQLDNTLGVDYDNSYIGYGCGFHSNGYMVVHLTAIGGPGIHLIDLYPMLYSVSPSFPDTPLRHGAAALGQPRRPGPRARLSGARRSTSRSRS